MTGLDELLHSRVTQLREIDEWLDALQSIARSVDDHAAAEPEVRATVARIHSEIRALRLRLLNAIWEAEHEHAEF